MLKKETKGTLAVFGLAILIATAPLLACAGNAPQEPAPVEETEAE